VGYGRGASAGAQGADGRVGRPGGHGDENPCARAMCLGTQVGDFGLSHLLPVGATSIDTNTWGTPLYSAPEALLGHASMASDGTAIIVNSQGIGGIYGMCRCKLWACDLAALSRFPVFLCAASSARAPMPCRVTGLLCYHSVTIHHYHHHHHHTSILVGAALSVSRQPEGVT
jgi:hypothetical protein